MNINSSPRFSAAYRHPLFYCIQTYSQLGLSFIDMEGATHLLPRDCADADLGMALKDALAKSRFFSSDIAAPPGFLNMERVKVQYAKWVATLMGSYKLKTKRALFQDFDYCIIREMEQVIHVEPQCHTRMEGWEEPRHGAVKVSIDSGDAPEQIGKLLREAFDSCTATWPA